MSMFTQVKKTNFKIYIVSETNHSTTCRFAVTTVQDEKQSGKIVSKRETCTGQWIILQQQHCGRKHLWDCCLDKILVSVFFTKPPDLRPNKEKLSKNK